MRTEARRYDQFIQPAAGVVFRTCWSKRVQGYDKGIYLKDDVNEYRVSFVVGQQFYNINIGMKRSVASVKRSLITVSTDMRNCDSFN
jgi:hypothetical protein